MGGFTTRIARGLVALMEARDADGYVFRTDLRLRPDPAATPPAVALPAAITYYESMGQNWERAAMIKARPVAGDLALGAAFLEAIRPFVWRRGLDFAAVADIHAMKRRIDEHQGRRAGRRRRTRWRASPATTSSWARAASARSNSWRRRCNWSGAAAIPACACRTTLGALRLLARAGHVPAARRARTGRPPTGSCAGSSTGLQMVADRQTHELPERPAELARVRDLHGLSRTRPPSPPTLLRHLDRVRTRYAEVFELVPELLEPGAPAPELDFSGVDAAPERTAAALRALGFGNPERIVAAVRGWQAGHVRALRSERARELMAQMLPRVLAALGAPAAAGRGVQPVRRFPGAPAGRRAAAVAVPAQSRRCSTGSPRCWAPRRRWPTTWPATPAALDGLLAPEEDADPARLLRARLRDARLLEDAIEIIRRTVREEDFAISVATMEGRLDADAAGLRRTALADAALSALAAAGAGGFRRALRPRARRRRWRWWRWARRAGGR